MTTAQKLAIFLRTGVKGKSAVQLASELLERFGSLRGIFEANNEDLMAVDGLGRAKVAQIKAVAVLAEEYVREKLSDKPVLDDLDDLKRYLTLTMRDLKQEVFKILCLDTQRRLILSGNSKRLLLPHSWTPC